MKPQTLLGEFEELYPNIVKPIYQFENQYSKGVKVNTQFNFSRVKGKYSALCEGDDYWTDPYKLQKQVDFLEKNPDYSVCVGGFINMIDGTGEKVEIIKRIPGD
ncbi:MAG: hypothetical protein IPF68_08565 [Bacteroidales bacterium]|nr:hypothetical protein [Bacteroidales bacterium]